MSGTGDVQVREARADDVDAIAEVLVSVVASGASVGFLSDLDVGTAAQWARGHVGSASTVVLVAELDGRVVGTGSLVLAGLPNGRHRAEVAKVLVHDDAQGSGLGRLLLRALESRARERGLRTLVLDTVSGSRAQSLYESEGWTVVGEIPDYADLPDGTPSPTTYLYKRLT